MILKDLTSDALDSVYNIEQQAHTHPWTKAALASAFVYNHVIGLYLETKLVGFAILLDSIDALELLDIAVAPSYQHQGYGYQLLQAVIKLTQEKKLPRILLEVRLSNQHARQLYQQVGFLEIHRRKGYYVNEDGPEDALIMEYRV